nr:hypothetical protein [Tanacetum cinerariifolium]
MNMNSRNFESLINLHKIWPILACCCGLVESGLQERPILACCCRLVESGLQERYGLTEMEEGVAGKGVQKLEEKRIEEEQSATAQNQKLPVCYDDDDDEEESNSLKDNNISELPPCSAVTPNEPFDSVSMGDEHLDTIPATESDEFINSYFPEEIFSNPLFEEEINSMRIGQHHFNVESDLVGSLLNHDSSVIPSSSKIDSLLDEFTGELPLLKSIQPGIEETDYHPENEIRLSQRLLYDNSSPRPPEEFVSENSNADAESFSPSPIPIEDSDYPVEEINITFTPDDPMPPSIEEDDDDSRDILIREELLDNYSLSLHENESFHFDIPLSSHGNTGILNIKMMGDNSKRKVPIHELMITRVSNQEKSPDLLSHRGLEISQLSAKCLMMIHGKNIPILDVPIFYFYSP